MATASLKRRRTEDQLRKRVPKKANKKIKKQKYYHSSSEDEGGARDAPLENGDKAEESSQPLDTNSALLVNSNLSEHQAEKRTESSAQRREGPENIARDFSADAHQGEVVEYARRPAPKTMARMPMKSVLKKVAPVDHEAALPSDIEDEETSHSEPEADEFDTQDSGSDVSSASSGSETSTAVARRVRKRNDPDAFAKSMSKILNSKLTTSKRSEPILSRSKDAQRANRELADGKLEEKARRQVVTERKAAQDIGRVKDVLGLNDLSTNTAETSMREKELRRTAQKGVIKLFNAVRAAQAKGEQAEREAREKNVVGMTKREARVKEMSKQGFLDMINGAQAGKETSG